MPYMESGKKGVFVLVRTSNKGAEDFENLDIKDGKKLYNAVADKITEAGQTVKMKMWLYSNRWSNWMYSCGRR